MKQEVEPDEKINASVTCQTDLNFPHAQSTVNINGLIVHNDWISKEKEVELLEWIDRQPWIKQSVEKRESLNRRVQHYEIPTLLADLLPGLCKAGMPKLANQVTINEYLPEQGIGQHVDTHLAFDDGIASLSLGSLVTLEMTKTGMQTQHLAVPARTLMIMTGESRYAWTHGISARKTDVLSDSRTVVERQRRVSIIFRTARGGECHCDWPSMCACQSPQLVPPKTKEERELVVDFYDRIADHFSHTHEHRWLAMEKVIKKYPSTVLMLDVGCGNGRHMPVAENAMGCDIIDRFCHISRDRGLNVIRCDTLNLSYRTGIFDFVMCIAVLHHLSTEAARRRVIQEVVRVTRFKGEILLTVWSFEQDEKSKQHFDQQDTIVPWNLPARFNHQLEEDQVFNGYYHVFKEGELEALVTSATPNVHITVSWNEDNNWCLIATKIAM